MFKPIAGRAIEAALNRLVSLDPGTREELASLEGRTLRLVMRAPALALQLTVREGRFAVGPAVAPSHRNSTDGTSSDGHATDRPATDGSSTEPDLAIRGTLGGLLAQLPFLRGTSGAGAVHIAGDADLARQLQRLAERFDPDWNLPFTDLFGDVVGVQIATGVRTALRTGRDGAATFARRAAEFVTEESRDVIGRAELDAHLEDVDVLHDRVDRLAARMQQVQRRLCSAVPLADDGSAAGDG